MKKKDEIYLFLINKPGVVIKLGLVTKPLYYSKKSCYFNKYLKNKQLKAKKFEKPNKKFYKNKSKYNVFLADYKRDFDNNIDNNNKKINYSDNNTRNST